MISIFLDSNIIFQDPFFKGTYSKILLKLLKEVNGKVYLSNVVMEESESNYRKNIHKKVKDHKKAFNELNFQLSEEVQTKLEALDETVLVNKFKEFYNKLRREGLVEFVYYSNKMLPALVKRSIEKKKPFSENKEEFRDAIIWLSYVEHSDNLQLENCFFLSNNSTDFYEGKDKKSEKASVKFHPDLLSDSEKFTPYQSIRDFIVGEKELIDGLKTEFENNFFISWLKSNRISEYQLDGFLEDRVLNSKYFDEIYDKLSDFIIDGDQYELSSYEVFNSEEFSGEIVSVEPWSMDNSKIVVLNHEIFDDEIIFSGSAEVNFQVENYTYNHYHVGAGEFSFIYEFSVTYQREVGFDNFEVYDIVVQVNE